ncbi:hypothetical protein, partial [Paracraurococcus ruber]|uniref:hypothetical protein n=1 Tax=Paracraurococcus ruber TaxID=77675 RepID=UPI0019619A42
AARRAAAAATGALRLAMPGDADLHLPTAMVLHVVPGQAAPPAPGRPAGTLGYVGTAAGDALVLDPAALGLPAGDGALPLLVVLDLDGHCLALPCLTVGPGEAAPAAALRARLA